MFDLRVCSALTGFGGIAQPSSRWRCVVINGDQMIKVCVLLVGNHLCGVLCGRAVCAAMVWLLQLQTLQQTRGDMYGAGTTWQGIVSCKGCMWDPTWGAAVRGAAAGVQLVLLAGC